MREQSRDRSQHYAETVARRHRVLTIAAWLAVMVSASFVLVQIVTDTWSWQISSINLGAAAIFAFVPRLHRFGDLVAPLTFVSAAYVSVFASSWDIGTGSGGEFFFLVGVCLVVLLLGIEHIALAAGLAAVAAGGIIALEFLVPHNTGLQPAWATSAGFVVTTVSSCLMIVVTVSFALRDTARAEAVMEAQYDRSEALLANMLPASIAERLKEPDRSVIADKYDEASVLFADIVGFTERASSTAPADLVRFLDKLYSAFDALVDKHGLEKIKVSGDSYMVVSGVPRPRPDHIEALADFAIEMADVAAGLKDPHGLSVPLRVGMAWVPGGSSTTCGVMRSTSRPGWNPPTRWGAFKCPRMCTSA
jgi:adenylate cyclase